MRCSISRNPVPSQRGAPRELAIAAPLLAPVVQQLAVGLVELGLLGWPSASAARK